MMMGRRTYKDEKLNRHTRGHYDCDDKSEEPSEKSKYTSIVASIGQTYALPSSIADLVGKIMTKLAQAANQQRNTVFQARGDLKCVLAQGGNISSICVMIYKGILSSSPSSRL